MFDWNETARHFLKTWLPHTCASDAASPTDIMTAPGGIGWGWLLRQQRAVPSIHTYTVLLSECSNSSHIRLLMNCHSLSVFPSARESTCFPLLAVWFEGWNWRLLWANRRCCCSFSHATKAQGSVMQQMTQPCNKTLHQSIAIRQLPISSETMISALQLVGDYSGFEMWD